jgi:hypothetical protein
MGRPTNAERAARAAAKAAEENLAHQLAQTAPIIENDDESTDSDDEHTEIHADSQDGDAGHHGDVHEEWPSEWQVPEDQLKAPPPRPGMSQRWCRISVRGQPDAENGARSFGQGWRPRRLATVPVGERLRYPTVKHAKHGDIIAVGALILHERPQYLTDQRNAYFDAKRKRQEQSLVDDNIARTNKEKAPGFGNVHFEERTTERVNVRRPPVAAS